MRRPRDKRSVLAAAYLGVGVLLIVVLVATKPFPPVLPWAIFACAAAFIEWHSVEVNDRLWISSSVVVLFAAGVGLGDSGAALPMAMIAAIGAIAPADVRERRVFQPAVNFGQLVITAVVSGMVVDRFAGLDEGLTSLWRLAFVAGVAAVIHASLNAAQVTLVVRFAYGPRSIRPWSQMSQIVPAYAVMGALGGLLGGTYLIVGPEVTPLIVAMALLGHFAISSFAALREAHESTMRGFIKALEARDLYARGHTERVAMFCRLTAEQFHLSPERIQRLRWASYVHEVSTLAVPRDLLHQPHRLTGEEKEQLAANMRGVDEMLAEVDFLEPVMEVVFRRDVPFADLDDSDFSQDAQILVVAKHFDEMTAARSMSDALTQDKTFERLRAKAGVEYDPAVIDALEAGIATTGRKYGAVEVRRRMTREEYAKQRMYERR